MKRQYFEIPPEFSRSANILYICWYFRQAPMFLLDFVAANICVYFQCLFMHFVYANIFGAIVLKLRFKIDAVVMIIWSIVIVINSVLTLQVSTASLPHNREPCEIKVVSNHTCLLHTCVCAGLRRVRLRLSGLRWQESVQLLGVSSSALFRSGSVPNNQNSNRSAHGPTREESVEYK
jgi:hypothetical protein